MDADSQLVCRYFRASGPSFDDCVFLGQRFLEEWGDAPNESDYWALGNRPAGTNETTTTVLFSWKDWLTGIWRSPAGVTYISDATTSGVHRYDDIFDVERPPTDFALGVALEGIGGLDDGSVYTWGTRKNAAGQFEWPVFQFDGHAWKELPLPGLAVMDMHGVTPDRIHAVGFDGFIGVWDGRRWQRSTSPTREVLCCVFDAGTEVFACGENGSILRGERGGDWRPIARMMEGMPARAVAAFQGDLYVAGGSLGLFRQRGSDGDLELIKPNISASWFDVGESLVITADNAIAGTADGTSFQGAGINTLCQLTADQEIIDWEGHL